ncbi:MAG: hypothetical protein JO273_07290 [Methylobacteriaceae bacterium]|nr:hypothetical protein [Methylobacteriaceae bacterium]
MTRHRSSGRGHRGRGSGIGPSDSMGVLTPASIAAATGVQSTGDVTQDLQRELDLLTANEQQRQKILEDQRIEQEQAKLGADATEAQKQKVADLVKEIDATAAAQQKVANQQQAMNEAWAFGAQTLTSGIERAVVSGSNLTDVLKSIEEALARAALQATLLGEGPLAGLFGTKAQGSALGGLFGSLASGTKGLFSGFFAAGGTIPPGSFGIAGEAGPELIRAGSSPLQVYPNLVTRAVASGGAAAQAGGTVVNHFHIATPDVASFAQSQAQLSGMLTRAVQRGARTL